MNEMTVFIWVVALWAITQVYFNWHQIKMNRLLNEKIDLVFEYAQKKKKEEVEK